MGKIKNTKFASHCLNDVCEGCKYCVKGEKLVLFIGGVCKRNCAYCSLSNKRKNSPFLWANERKCENIKEVIEEAIESNTKGAGITGGDPLLYLDKTIKYASALKKKFGKKFHIHIYLPTLFVTEEKIKRLSKVVDEIRFHPWFLSKKMNEREIGEDLQKILIANKYFDTKNIGVEMPMLPDRKEEIFCFISMMKDNIGFVNLNELEIGETNFDFITKNYKLKKGGYTVSGSIESGLWILQQAKKENLKLKIHLCAAQTKNWYQYRNRLKMHNVLPFGYKTKEGTVRYFAVYEKDNNSKIGKIWNDLKKFKEVHLDKVKRRVLVSQKVADKIYQDGKYKLSRIEEYPTFNGEEVYLEVINP